MSETENTSDMILLAHGSGGLMMHELIKSFFDSYNSDELRRGDDAAVLVLDGFNEIASEKADSMPDAAAAALVFPTNIAFSTDTFVVTPRFFPGGDIGRLAVCGTVNDVATSGAIPRWLSVAFVLEEGFARCELQRICVSMAEAAAEAGVVIVTGDTKVVQRGQGDGVYINTSGIGVFPDAARAHSGSHCKPGERIPPGSSHCKPRSKAPLGGSRCKPGDKILLSGTLGDHGIAIISQREGLKFETTIQSDAAPLNHLVQAVLAAAPHTRCFRDPTRGGLASTVNELAAQSNTVFEIDEEAVPVNDQVRGACDMLGYDVFHVANEGKMVAVVPADEAEAALEAMKASRYGKNAAIIGDVLALPENDAAAPKAYVRTAFGSRRILDMLAGEQLPRIC